VLDAQEDIKSQVQEELGERQREMLLREQMKAIRKELGEEGEAAEADDLRKRLEALDLPEAARKEVDRELTRLERAGRESMEAQVIRTYLETVAELPWNKRADESLDLKRAEEILEDRTDRLTVRHDRGLAAGVLAENGRKAYLDFDGHSRMLPTLQFDRLLGDGAVDDPVGADDGLGILQRHEHVVP